MSQSSKSSDKHLLLAEVIAKLERNHQRATYGAVGGIVGLPSRSVMSGQPKTSRNSWVVSAKTKLPTGYSQTECHSFLEANRRVIASVSELAAWLREHA